MQFVSELRDRLRDHGVGHLADRLLEQALPALHLQKVGEPVREARRLFGVIPLPARRGWRAPPAPIGSSRMGGLPDLTPEASWPTTERGAPLEFLLQLRCADAAAWAATTGLPTTGLLSFFALTGFHTKGAVLFAPDEGSVRPHRPPAARLRVLPAAPFRLQPVPSFADDGEPDALPLPEDEAEQVAAAIDEWQQRCLGVRDGEWDGLHRIGGHPSAVQNDVRENFDYLERKRRAGGPGGDLPPYDVARHGAWRLLLQFDSDTDLGVMWGDAGRLYFGILDADLRDRRFERAVLEFQCS